MKYTTQSHRPLGWVRDLPDNRDYLYGATIDPRALPTKHTLSTLGLNRPIQDQGQLGSCTAFSVDSVVEFVSRKQGNQWIDPSELFTYFQERKDQNTIEYDSGASIRESIKACATYGVAPESDWPYKIELFKNQPPAIAYTDALKHVVKDYLKLAQTALAIKSCIVEGFPVCFGFSVYDGFESAEAMRSGLVSLPKAGERLLGGHAMHILDFDDDMTYDGLKGFYKCPNSWGTNYGDKGFMWMPYDYLHSTSLAADFWTIKQVTAPIIPQPQPTQLTIVEINAVMSDRSVKRFLPSV